LVAADGSRSRIRQACAREVQGFSVEEEPWGFQLRFMKSTECPDQKEVDPETLYALGNKGYVAQQPNGVWSVLLYLLPGLAQDFLTAQEASEERVQRLREYTEKHASLFAANLLDDEAYRGFYQNRAYDGLVIKCSCLNPAGWICLIGDAAQAVQPTFGEGINSALEDAAVLGKLAAECPEDPFAAFDAQHRANAHALHKRALQARDMILAPSTRRKAITMRVAESQKQISERRAGPYSRA